MSVFLKINLSGGGDGTSPKTDRANRRRAVAATIFIFLLLPSLAFAKPPKGIEIGVEVGYDGYVQPGRVNPVAVTLRNSTQNLNISGELVLSYNGIEYTAPLELPTPSEKRFFLYFPCADYSPQLTLRVRSRQYTDEFMLAEPAAFKTIRAEDISVMVLSRQQGALNMLNQKSLARLYRNWYRSTSSELSSGRVYVSYYKPDQIDANAKFFRRADVIVLSDIDYQQVTPEMATALSEAVSGGASLVFSLGFNGAGVAGGPLAAMCPLQYSGTTQTGDLGQFGQRYKIKTGSSPAVLAVGKVAPDAAVLDWAGQLPVVVQVQRGSGTVTALAFDITEAPFKRNAQLASVFIENMLDIDDTASVTNSFMHPYPLQLLLGKLSEAKPMDPGFVFLYLISYIVLIGPLNFLILDRFKRRTLVWTTIPLLIIAFSGLGMQTGYLRRGANNIAAYVQELHIYPGATYAPYQTVMTLFTARRADYSLEIDDKGAFIHASIPAPRENYGMGSQQSLALVSRGKLLTAGKPMLRASQGQWDSRFYAYQGHLALEGGGASSNLAAEPSSSGLNSLSGTFTLNLPCDIKACQLIGPGGFRQDVGDLAAHGAYDVSNLSTSTSSLNLPGNYLADDRQALLDLVRQSDGFELFYRDELLLVGFTDELDTKARLSTRGKSYRLGMVIVHLPYREELNTNSPPQVRTVLTGGSAFELREQGGSSLNSYGSQQSLNTSANPSAQRTYQLKANSVLNVTCTVSGNIQGGKYMLLHLQGWDGKQNQISDIRNYIRVEYLSGNTWTPIRLTDPRSVLIPLTGAEEQRRHLQVRITADSECTLEMPSAEI